MDFLGGAGGCYPPNITFNPPPNKLFTPPKIYLTPPQIFGQLNKVHLAKQSVTKLI